MIASGNFLVGLQRDVTHEIGIHVIYDTAELVLQGSRGRGCRELTDPEKCDIECQWAAYIHGDW